MPTKIVKFILYQLNQLWLFFSHYNLRKGINSWQYEVISLFLVIKIYSLLCDRCGILFVNQVLELFLLLLEKLHYFTLELHNRLLLSYNVLRQGFTVLFEQASKFRLINLDATQVLGFRIS